MSQKILKIFICIVMSCHFVLASPAPTQEVLRIPFSIQQDFIIVDVRLNGIIPLQFIFDTGAENTILFDKLYADLLQTKYDMRIPIVGSNLQSVRYALVARNIALEVADLPSRSLDILVLEEYEPKLREYLGQQIHGIIGNSFFHNSAVEIDYKKQLIKIHPPNSLSERELKRFHPIDITIRRGKPYVQSNVLFSSKDSTNTVLLLDTGAGINLLIHTNTDESLRLPEQTISGELGVGVSGVIKGYVGRLHKFDLGPYEYRSMITSFQDLDSGFLNQSDYYRNGIIGNSLLRRFHIIIDYVNDKLYLSPEKGYADDFKYDMSGLTVIASGNNLRDFYIQSILQGSPADSIGLQTGDKLLKVQCWPASFYTLGKINKLLKKKEGKRIRLRVKRGDKKLRFQFKLRKLI